MKQIATIQFKDAGSNQDAVAIVRAEEGHIALCLSLQNDGDVEALLEPLECQRLSEALQLAIQVAASQSTQ